MLGTNEHRVLLEIVQAGVQNASIGLSQMAGQPFLLDAPRVLFLPLKEVPGIAGGPAAVVVAVYLGVEGDVCGHLLLMFTTDSARRVAELLMDLPAGSVSGLDELCLSALAEAGNVGGSFFLNALAGRTGLTVTPTPPAVLTDMAGAILEAVVAELYLVGEEALVVETGWGGEVTGHFLLLPDQESMARLIAALERIG